MSHKEFMRGLVVGELSLLAHNLARIANEPLATFTELTKEQKQLISLAERALGSVILQVEGCHEPITETIVRRLHDTLSEAAIMTPESIAEHPRLERQYQDLTSD